ncbi:Fggy [Symbiodinium microadriaticum]|nr:Fggy [Symbiodinium microadriaticum]CAE7944254.1 Fggy [Symbiodinium sp. KB8]
MVEPIQQHGERSASPVKDNPRERSRSPKRDRGADVPRQVSVSVTGNGVASRSSLTLSLEPAKITEQVRKVLGEDCDSLPVIVGIVCAQLASKQALDIQTVSQQIVPHLPSEKQSRLKDLLSWLEEASEAAKSDPRLSQAPNNFQEGDAVTLHGLEKRPDLNGCTAEVLRVADPSQPGRIVLKLESGSQIAIRPQNLQHVQLEGSAEASEKPSDRQDEAPTPKKPQPNSGSSSYSGPDPSASKVFGSAFERLKAKAEAEARGELPADRRKKAKTELDTRGGIGSSQPAGQARRELIMGTEPKESQTEVAEEPPKREPINFVPAEEKTLMPSRKVTVIDPRRNGRPAEDSDDEEVGTPGVVRPRKSVQDNGSSWQGSTSFDSPKLKACKDPEPVCRMPAAPARGLARTPSVPHSPTPTASKSYSTPPASARGNMTLVVSADAREADKAQRELAEKRKAMEEGKRHMLAKLTKQMQLCLAKLQNPDLDDNAKEKYQDMITSLKTNMSKLGNV